MPPAYDLKTIYPNQKRLSSSQALGYEKSPPEFYTEYVLGVRRPTSVPMHIGSIFSELYRDRSYEARKALAYVKAPARIADLFERVIVAMPVVESEVALIATLNGWGIRATLDGFDDASDMIIENKTGGATLEYPNGWTQERVNFNDQITLQAWVFWKLKGRLPRKIQLNWVDTRANAVNPLHTFKTSRSVKALKLFERRLECIIENVEAQNWTQYLYEN